MFFFSCSAGRALAVQLELHHQGVVHLSDPWVLYLFWGLSQRLKHGKSSGHNYLSDGGGCLLGFNCETWTPKFLPDATFFSEELWLVVCLSLAKSRRINWLAISYS